MGNQLHTRSIAVLSRFPTILLVTNVFILILLSYVQTDAFDPEPPHTDTDFIDSEFAWLLAKPTPPATLDEQSVPPTPSGTELLTDTFAIHLPVILTGSGITDDERTNDDPNEDNDGDGLTNAIEAILGTNPNAADSDCDYLSDLAEVVDINAPVDGDADGLIDALESRLIDSNRNDVNDEADGSVGSSTNEDGAVAVQINCANFFPFAVMADGSENSTLEARLVGHTNVTQVVAAVTVRSSYPSLDGALLSFDDQFSLFDDGTHGDKVEGDGIWTRNGFNSVRDNLRPNWSYEFRLRHFTVTTSGDGGDVTGTLDLAVNAGSTFAQATLFILSPDAVGTPVVIHSSLQHLPNLLNIVNPELALSLKENGGITVAMTQQFYTMYGDDYDFLFFFPDAYAVSAPYGSHRSVQNSVANIGKPSFDNSSDYGSTGRLLGTMFMNLGGGPTLHELLHQWAVGGLNDLGFNQCIDSSHWGYTGHGEGQLGGFNPATLVDNGNGTYTVDSFGAFANGGDSVPYTALEKYLAGFVGPEEVQPVTIPINVGCSSIDYSTPGKITFAADGLQSVSIATITNHLGGLRAPDHITSRKNFTAAFTVLSERPLTSSEMAVVDLEAKHLSGENQTDLYSFAEATGGTASMVTTIALPCEVTTR